MHVRMNSPGTAGISGCSPGCTHTVAVVEGDLGCSKAGPEGDKHILEEDCWNQS